MPHDRETPATMAPKLGVSPTALRQWLRRLVNEKHELVKHHQHSERWVFSAHDAKALLDLFRREHP